MPKDKTCDSCRFYRAFTLKEGLCVQTGARCLADTKACSLIGMPKDATFHDELVAEASKTEAAIDKARANGHWKCVRDLEKKLEKQRKDIREYERRGR